MLLSLELNARQAARVLEYARRAGARVELAMRCLPDEQLLFGALRPDGGSTLAIDLDGGGVVDPARLIGAYCDATVLLPGELYQFTSCVLDVGDQPGRLIMNTPNAVTLVNRRRFERTRATIHSTALIRGVFGDCCGRLEDVSASGVALVLPMDESQDAFYIGDPLRLRFELPGSEGFFDLPAQICSKTIDRANMQISLGLEFDVSADDAAAAESLVRLRALLFEMTVDLFEAD